MKDIGPILRSLGLLESEIKTYTVALERGPSTVIELSKATSLSRQACYVAIEALTKRGLMSSVLKGKRNYYAAEHPSKLVSYARRREVEIGDQIKDLERAIPRLELQVRGDRPVVKLFEGKEGLQAFIDDMELSSPGEIREIADVKAVGSVLTEKEIRDYQEKVKKFDPKVRGFYSGVPIVDKLNTQRIFLSDKDSGFNADIFIYDDKIALVTFENKMFSVILESPALAKALKILFDQAWDKSKNSNK